MQTIYLFALICIQNSVGLSEFGEDSCWTPPNSTVIFFHSSNLLYARVAIPSKLRITAQYTNLFKELDDYENLKKNAVEPALEYWRTTLRAKNPLTENFYASRSCNDGASMLVTESDGSRASYCTKGCRTTTPCYNYALPDDNLDYCKEVINGVPTITGTRGTGLASTDFLVIVDATNVDACNGGLLAFATTCQIDDQLNRPVLGLINLCSRSLSLTYPRKELTKYTLLHEFAHALGFSPLLYAFMRDENGNPRTSRNSINNLPKLGQYANRIYIPNSSTVDQVTRAWLSAAGQNQRTFTIFKTPNVLATAREHFSCPTLEGIEMENQGGSGTSSAHFEKRVVFDELMAGSLGKSAFVSKLTLSYFKDTGWYDVDFTKADNWQWGKGLGCDFVEKSCYEYWKLKEAAGQSINPWCKTVKSTDTVCLSYDNAYGSCNLIRYSQALPAENQYFTTIPGVAPADVPYYGGRNALADYCPTVTPSFGDGSIPSTHCRHIENEAIKGKNLQLEAYGPNSMCFAHDTKVPWKTYQCSTLVTQNAVTASCHKYVCSATAGLIVILDKKEYQCPLLGGTARINTVTTSLFLHGNITCPPCSEKCDNCPTNQSSSKSEPDMTPAVIPCSSKALSIHTGYFLSIMLLAYFLKKLYF